MSGRVTALCLPYNIYLVLAICECWNIPTSAHQARVSLLCANAPMTTPERFFLRDMKDKTFSLIPVLCHDRLR